jgi:hypothetical protein
LQCRNNDADDFKAKLLPIFLEALHPLDPNDARVIEYTDDLSKLNESKSEQGAPILHVPVTCCGEQKYCVDISNMVANCESLVKAYRDLAPEPCKGNEVPKESTLHPRLAAWQSEFAEDKQAILQMLVAGKKVVMREVEGMLADRYREVRGRSNLSRDEEMKGRHLLAKGTSVKDGAVDEGSGRENEDGTDTTAPLMGWGNAAHDVQKAMGRLGRLVDGQV